MDSAGTDPLARIRQRIDTLDADIHRMLIERSAVIDELIRVKGTSAPGAAFRPDREADMMRRLVLRHEGRLPLATVEHIWREIITVFTAMQAPFSVITGPADDLLAQRDMVRFYFGFSVEIETAATEDEALAMVAGGENRIAALSLRDATPWWQVLEADTAPKIFARFPFLVSPDRRDLPPLYIAGPALKGQAQTDIRLISLSGYAGAPRDVGIAAEQIGGRLVLHTDQAALLEIPADVDADQLAGAFEISDDKPASIGDVGGFAEPIEILAGGEA